MLRKKLGSHLVSPNLTNFYPLIVRTKNRKLKKARQSRTIRMVDRLTGITGIRPYTKYPCTGIWNPKSPRKMSKLP